MSFKEHISSRNLIAIYYSGYPSPSSLQFFKLVARYDLLLTRSIQLKGFSFKKTQSLTNRTNFFSETFKIYPKDSLKRPCNVTSSHFRKLIRRVITLRDRRSRLSFAFKAQFKRRSFHVPNLIPPIKYVEGSTFEQGLTLSIVSCSCTI